MTQIGTADVAREIAAHHHGGADWLPDGCEQIGTGSHRTVYLDWATGTVYKVGDDGANRHEVRVLAEIRQRGDDYAPEVTLHEVEITDQWGEQSTCSVVAMPYLPEDGSVTGERPIFPEAADLNPAGNVHANGGRLWLIDAGGM